MNDEERRKLKDLAYFRRRWQIKVVSQSKDSDKPPEGISVARWRNMIKSVQNRGLPT